MCRDTWLLGFQGTVERYWCLVEGIPCDYELYPALQCVCHPQLHAPSKIRRAPMPPVTARAELDMREAPIALPVRRTPFVTSRKQLDIAQDSWKGQNTW